MNVYYLDSRTRELLKLMPVELIEQLQENPRKQHQMKLVYKKFFNPLNV